MSDPESVCEPLSLLSFTALIRPCAKSARRPVGSGGRGKKGFMLAATSLGRRVKSEE